MIQRVMQALNRFRTPVDAFSLTRTSPISSSFGIDRGRPIDRYYIEKFLARNESLIHGSVLEVADSTYSRMFGSSVEQYEVLHNSPVAGGATIIGDLADPETLPAGTIDCFICTQTLNFIYDIRSAVAGIHRLLKPGGVVLITVAGVCQISRFDMDRWGDYWRFTTKSLSRLLGERLECVDVESFGNVAAAMAFLQGMAMEDLPDPTVLDVSDADYQIVIGAVARKLA